MGGACQIYPTTRLCFPVPRSTPIDGSSKVIAQDIC